MVWRESGFVSFGSLFGPYAIIVKKVAGVGGGARSARTFFFPADSLKNSKESSQTLAITAKVCKSKTSLSWPLGFAARSRGEKVCMTEPCRVLQKGYTPLHWASYKGHSSVVANLLAAGAVTDAKTEVRRVGDEGYM